jgi:hypothetical protein
LTEFFDDEARELYDLAGDVGETKDLSRVHVDKTRALQKDLSQCRLRVRAEMPESNRNYDPKRAGEWGSQAKRN